MANGRRMVLSRRGFMGGLATFPVLSKMGLAQPTLDGPIVFWKTDPVAPGQTLMLFGDALGTPHATAVHLADSAPGQPNSPIASVSPTPTTLKTLQQENTCLKLEIPATWPLGCYAVRVEKSRAPEIIVNRPEIWWHLGDKGTTSTPGTEAKIFGKNFKLGPETVTWKGKAVLRDTAGTFHPLTLTGLNPYTASFQLPKDIAPGKAALYLHNGFGGPGAWSPELPIEITAPTPWPTTVFNVKDFGAKGDSATDDTAALRAALDKAKSSGGGVVFLPRGIYSVAEQLTIPARTTLRGEGLGIVWIVVPHKAPAFHTLIAGDSEFAVEDLSMVARMPLRMVTAPDVDSMYEKPWGHAGKGRVHDVFLRRLRIQHLHYEGRVEGTDPRRQDDVGPSTIAMAGSNIEISDCDIVSSGMPFILHDLRSSRVLRNNLHTGRNGWYGFWGAREIWFEGNTIRGQDMEASYGGFGDYEPGDGEDVSHIYIQGNQYLDGYGGEREALTFDSPGTYPWKGPITSAGASTLSVDGVTWEIDAFRNLAVIICAGKGLGQHRRIVSNTAGQLTVDKPWDVPLDHTTVASIGPYRRDIIVYQNDSQDASVGVQLWGGGYNYIIDSNHTIRTGGFWGTAAEYDRPPGRMKHAFMPLYFTQWLNNTIKEPMAYNAQYDTGVSMWATLGLICRDTLAETESAVLIYGNLIRGNQLADRAQIVLSYSGSGHRGNARKNLKKGRPPVGMDTVIEGNSITDGTLGILIEPGYEGTLVRNNQFTRVTEQIREGKWVD